MTWVRFALIAGLMVAAASASAQLTMTNIGAGDAGGGVAPTACNAMQLDHSVVTGCNLVTSTLGLVIL